MIQLGVQAYPTNPNPSKLQLSQPNSSFQIGSGKEMLFFWGGAIITVFALIWVLKSMYKR